jgi:hypothetical protein
MPRGVYSRVLFAPRRVARIAHVNYRILFRSEHPPHHLGACGLISAHSLIFFLVAHLCLAEAKNPLLKTILQT